MSKLMQYNGKEWIEIKGKDADEKAVEQRVLAKIPKPKDGYSPIKGVDYFDGEDGYTPVKNKDYFDGKDGSPDTPNQIAEKLNTLEKVIDISVIKDLQETLDDLKKKWTSRPIFGGGGFSVGAMNFHLIDDETPTGTVNGVNTVFTLANVPSPAQSLKVFKDGQRMKLTTDYTVSGGTITFVEAPLTDAIITCDYRT